MGQKFRIWIYWIRDSYTKFARKNPFNASKFQNVYKINIILFFIFIYYLIGIFQVKSGTKIRNVLGYALKEFVNYNCIVWTAAGHGIGKAISCAELFKKKQESLHQITRLRYVE